jgi:hypothetical protein
MSERARRVGENEALFRGINERLEEVSDAFEWMTGSLQIVCECGDRSCIERIELEPSEYEGVRADPTHFAVLRGHDDPSVEEIVGDRGSWVVVRKYEGAPAEIAERTSLRQP